MTVQLTCNEWLEKYKPCSTADLVGNTQAIAQIRNYIVAFKQVYAGEAPQVRRGLFVYGPSGVGKTLAVTLALREAGYDAIEFTASDIRSSKAVKETMDNVLGKHSVISLLSSVKREIAIVMDEIDGMSTGDKGGVAELIKIINPNKGKRGKNRGEVIYHNPIVCIANSGNDKKLSDLQKECEVVAFGCPTKADLLMYADQVCRTEGMQVEDDAQLLLISHSQYDIRKLMLLLYDLYCRARTHTGILTRTVLESQLTQSCQKCEDHTIFEITERALRSYEGINSMLTLNENDKALISMLIHENIIPLIQSAKLPPTQKLQIIHHMIDVICTGDKLDKYVYNRQAWTLTNYSYVLKTIYPSYFVQSHLPLPRRVPSIRFTSLLSKCSLQYSNLKTALLLKNMFRAAQEDMGVIIDMIMTQLLQTESPVQIQRAIDHLAHYGLTVSDTDKMVKIMKLNNDFKQRYTPSFKTRLRKSLGDREEETQTVV